MSSFILLRNENHHLTGRIVLSRGGGLFQRELPSQEAVEAAMEGEAPEVIIAAYFAPPEELILFVESLCQPHSNSTIYLVGSDLDSDTVIEAIRGGVRDVFLTPINAEDILVRVITGLGTEAGECAIDPAEWETCCSLLQAGPAGSGESLDGLEGDLEQTLMKLEAERQELELERQILAEERQTLERASGNGQPSEELKRELDRRANELEEQRYDFEEQKVFLMDAQKEVEAARMAWEDERAALEKSNEDLLKQLESLRQGEEKPGQEGRWLRSTIGSLPLGKGGRNSNGALTASESREVTAKLNALTETKRGLEAELEELSRAASQARTRQVELEEEVADLRRRYERTGGGGTVSGGSLLERLERLDETQRAFHSDLKSIRDRRSALKLQIETLSTELSSQEITEALTPAHLQRIREVKNQRKQLQEAEASLADEETNLAEDLEQNDRELIMIESWIEELDAARDRVVQLKKARIGVTQEQRPAGATESMVNQAPQEPASEATTGDPEPKKPIKTPPRARKGGLSRRFALRGMA